MKRTASIAQEPGKLASLPDKLPPSVEARVGKIDFRKGLPTQKGIEQLFEIQDFQRATQLYQWAIPAIGVMGWHRASIANGKTGEPLGSFTTTTCRDKRHRTTSPAITSCACRPASRSSATASSIGTRS